VRKEGVEEEQVHTEKVVHLPFLVKVEMVFQELVRLTMILKQILVIMEI